ncbi:hypothetical protein ACWD6P_04570 [Streptomyces sp. NPDC002446]
MGSSTRGVWLLYGVMLRGAARLDAGLELPDLEARLVQTLRSRMSEEEVHEIGRVFIEEASVRNAPHLFPYTLTSRDLAAGYSVADLFADLPALQSEILGQPNISLVDLDAPIGDRRDSEEVAAAVDAYGYGATMVTASGQQPETTAAPSRLHARVALSSFSCARKSNKEGDGEVYWAVSASGGVGDTERASFTREYGAMRAGHGADFDPEDVLFDGPVSHVFTSHIEVWEADHSNSAWCDELMQDLWEIAGFLSQVSAYLGLQPDTASQTTSEALEILGLISALISATMHLWRNEDDLVVRRTIGFDRGAIRHLAGQPGRVDTWWFDGGSRGTYELSLQWTGPGDTRLLTTTAIAIAGTWSASTPVPSVTALGTPALAAYDGKLHCMVRTHNIRFDSTARPNLKWAGFDGTTWSDFTEIPGALSPSNPAMAVYDGKLYSTHRSPDGELRWNRLNGTTWSAFSTVPSGVTLNAPALAAYKGKLYCMIRNPSGFSSNDGTISLATFDGTTWSSFTTLDGASTPSAPALAVFDSKLYAVYRSADSSVNWTTFDGTTWTPARKFPSGSTAAAPTLAAHDGTLHCLVRGAGSNESLFWTTLNGSTWNPFTKLTATSCAAPALAAFDNKLYGIHRGGTA